MSALPRANPYLPQTAEVIERVQEAADVFTLRLRLCDPEARARYRFDPGQFNMLYLFGVGEVPISIVSDPADPTLIDHTIRAVGRVTEGLVRLAPGERLGLRGPFGRGWPVEAQRGRDLLVITGGIGCAPTTSVVEYALQRREAYGRITVCHGVKHPDDLIYTQRFRDWERAPGTQVLLASQQATPEWPGRVGLVTGLLDEIGGASDAAAMMCGPEVMMRAVAEALLNRGTPIEDIYVSMERNMQCGLGHCGNCQFGKDFLCKDGPVFPYAQVRELLEVRGY